MTTLTISIPTAAEVAALDPMAFAAGFIASGETSILYRDRAGADREAASAVAAVVTAMPEPAMRERHAKRLRDAIDYARSTGRNTGFRLRDKDGMLSIVDVDAAAEAKKAADREAAAAARKARKDAETAETAAALAAGEAAAAALAAVTAERDAALAALAAVTAERDALRAALAERDAALAALAAKPARSRKVG